MGTRPLLLILVSVCLTLAPAQENDKLEAKYKEVFGEPGQNSDTTTVLESSLPTAAPTIAVENKKDSQDTPCQCVPYYQCQNGTILTTGETLLDIRRGCADSMEICCQIPNVIPEANVVRPVRNNAKGCGVRNFNGVGSRISGTKDNEVQFGEFPWTVAILGSRPDTKRLILQCGGSLIHNKAVLTAAHCLRGKQPHELKIRAGEWDTRTKNEILPHQDRNVSSVIIHDKFHSGTLFYDFAILILSEPVDLAENVDFICLPEKDAVFDGSRCFAGGWGKNRFSAEGQYQVILKKTELPIMPRDTCQNNLRKTRLGKYFILDDSFICAGGETGKDTCEGDGGGPLVCPSKNDPTRYQQVGIVAWGIGCGENGIPGVYANVAYVRDWIDKQMASMNFDNTVYAL